MIIDVVRNAGRRVNVQVCVAQSVSTGAKVQRGKTKHMTENTVFYRGIYLGGA
jgi:hypothetical protein